jgi:BASS family bile acid:Na+ symporter
MNAEILEKVQLNWDPNTTILLNLAIAFIMFGVSLNLNKNSFFTLIKNPKPALVGIAAQFILLPMFTFILVWIFDPLPGLALGMILVAACPGGNLSNFFSALGKGNVALSISLTVAASFLAVILTPLNFELWGSMQSSTSLLLKKVSINFFEMMQLVFMTIALPLAIGLTFKTLYPTISNMINKPVRYISIIILVGIIALAFAKNYALLLAYYHYIVGLVFMHNALALALGYLISRATRLRKADARTITIETGIQNSALALLIIFTIFNGQGGMALIAAWWGIWHIISGFAIAHLFAFRSAQTALAS